MKSGKKEKNLYVMLIKNYVIFTMVLIVMFFLTYLFEVWAQQRILGRIRSGQQLVGQKELEAGEYEKLSLKKMLSLEGYFEIVTEDGEQVFAEEKRGTEPYTARELSYIPEYNTETFYNKTEYTNQDGTKQILVTRKHYEMDTGYEEEVSYCVYDTDLKLLFSSDGEAAGEMTDRELTLLTGGLDNGYRVYKHAFQNEEGDTLFALFHVQEMNSKRYQRLSLLWKLFIPIYAVIYIAVTVAFTIRMHRQVRDPLNMLNKGITDFALGKLDTEISYRGPIEFENIFHSFNRMARKLQESETAKEHLIEEKQRMLADISHDLKTPITVIQGYARAVADDSLTSEETKKQYLNTIVLKTDALTEMINTFYDYSKLEHPEFRLVRKKQDLAEFLREYLAEKYDEIDLMGFQLEAEIPEEEILFSFDNVQLKRVFDNIFNNALKHNPKGTIIYVTLQQTEKNIRIEMGDSGVGIPKELQKDLFEPFTVGDDSRNNRQGSGLGLAVARKIAELHGGALFLEETKKDKGMVSTLFVLNFIR